MPQEDVVPAPAAPAAPAAPTPPAYDDTDLVTVLYNYGTEAAKNLQRLGGINGLVAFQNGVARHVPYKVARMWATGKRVDIGPEGQERILPAAGGPIQVIILPDTATELDFMRAVSGEPAPGTAAGASESPEARKARLAAMLLEMAPAEYEDLLGRDNAVVLTFKLAEHLGLTVTEAFTGTGSSSSKAGAAKAGARR